MHLGRSCVSKRRVSADPAQSTKTCASSQLRLQNVRFSVGLGRQFATGVCTVRNLSIRKGPKKMSHGSCVHCGLAAWGDTACDLYCADCWEFFQINDMRCFTIAALYDDTGALISTATSLHMCAERQALWRVPHDKSARMLVVCRVRRNKKGIITSYGTSKPCVQCTNALAMYGVQEVWFSIVKGDSTESSNDLTSNFRWTASKVSTLKATLLTASSTIVAFENGSKQRNILGEALISTLPSWPLLGPRCKNCIL